MLRRQLSMRFRCLSFTRRLVIFCRRLLVWNQNCNLMSHYVNVSIQYFNFKLNRLATLFLFDGLILIFFIRQTWTSPSAHQSCRRGKAKIANRFGQQDSRFAFANEVAAGRVDFCDPAGPVLVISFQKSIAGYIPWSRSWHGVRPIWLRSGSRFRDFRLSVYVRSFDSQDLQFCIFLSCRVSQFYNSAFHIKLRISLPFYRR